MSLTTLVESRPAMRMWDYFNTLAYIQEMWYTPGQGLLCESDEKDADEDSHAHLLGLLKDVRHDHRNKSDDESSTRIKEVQAWHHARAEASANKHVPLGHDAAGKASHTARRDKHIEDFKLQGFKRTVAHGEAPEVTKKRKARWLEGHRGGGMDAKSVHSAGKLLMHPKVQPILAGSSRSSDGSTDTDATSRIRDAQAKMLVGHSDHTHHYEPHQLEGAKKLLKARKAREDAGESVSSDDNDHSYRAIELKTGVSAQHAVNMHKGRETVPVRSLAHDLLRDIDPKAKKKKEAKPKADDPDAEKTDDSDQKFDDDLADEKKKKREKVTKLTPEVVGTYARSEVSRRSSSKKAQRLQRQTDAYAGATTSKDPETPGESRPLPTQGVSALATRLSLPNKSHTDALLKHPGKKAPAKKAGDTPESTKARDAERSERSKHHDELTGHTGQKKGSAINLSKAAKAMLHPKGSLYAKVKAAQAEHAALSKKKTDGEALSDEEQKKHAAHTKLIGGSKTTHDIVSRETGRLLKLGVDSVHTLASTGKVSQQMGRASTPKLAAGGAASGLRSPGLDKVISNQAKTDRKNAPLPRSQEIRQSFAKDVKDVFPTDRKTIDTGGKGGTPHRSADPGSHQLDVKKDKDGKPVSPLDVEPHKLGNWGTTKNPSGFTRDSVKRPKKNFDRDAVHAAFKAKNPDASDGDAKAHVDERQNAHNKKWHDMLAKKHAAVGKTLGSVAKAAVNQPDSDDSNDKSSKGRKARVERGSPLRQQLKIAAKDKEVQKGLGTPVAKDDTKKALKSASGQASQALSNAVGRIEKDGTSSMWARVHGQGGVVPEKIKFSAKQKKSSRDGPVFQRAHRTDQPSSDSMADKVQRARDKADAASERKEAAKPKAPDSERDTQNAHNRLAAQHPKAVARYSAAARAQSASRYSAAARQSGANPPGHKTTLDIHGDKLRKLGLDPAKIDTRKMVRTTKPVMPAGQPSRTPPTKPQPAPVPKRSPLSTKSAKSRFDAIFKRPAKPGKFQRSEGGEPKKTEESELVRATLVIDEGRRFMRRRGSRSRRRRFRA